MKIEPVIYLEIFVTQIAISSMTFTAQQKYRIRKCYPMGALTTGGVCKFWLFSTNIWLYVGNDTR